MIIFEGYLHRLMAAKTNRLVTRRIIGAYLSSVISISLVLLLFGVAVLLMANAKSVSDYFKEKLQITVLMKQEVNEESAQKYCEKIQGLSFVRGTTLVSKEQGTKELQEMLGNDFLSVFESSPVPVSVEVSLSPDYVSADSLGKVTGALMDEVLVDEIECRQSLIDKLNSNLAKISLILGIFIAMLLFVSVVLIANVVRISAFAQRFTIHTMQLVGATRGFICKPFVFRSLGQGLLSSGIAIAIMTAGMFLVKSSSPQLAGIFSISILLQVFASMIFAGMVICSLSTYFVVRKIVSLNKDELYG